MSTCACGRSRMLSTFDRSLDSFVNCVVTSSASDLCFADLRMPVRFALGTA
jgi:hypothetical protein